LLSEALTGFELADLALYACGSRDDWAQVLGASGRELIADADELACASGNQEPRADDRMLAARTGMIKIETALKAGACGFAAASADKARPYAQLLFELEAMTSASEPRRSLSTKS